MAFTVIVGKIVFGVVFSVMLFSFIGAFFKNICISLSAMEALFFAVLCVAMHTGEYFMYHYLPDMFGVAYFFIVVELIEVLLVNYANSHSVFFTKKHIYVITFYLIPKRYSYGDVIGYIMKNDSYIVNFNDPKKIKNFMVQIYFSDNNYVLFYRKKETDRKVRYVKQTLESNRCHRNGRIKRENLKGKLSLM